MLEDNLKDQELVSRILSGQKDAFSELIDRYQKPLERYCLRLLNYHTQDAEDAVSNCFLKCYQNLAGFKPDYKFSSWIYRIAHNEAISLWRKKQNFFAVDLSEFWDIPNPDKSENLEIKSEILEEVIKKLSLNDREVLTLFYLEEKSLKDISDILKLTVNTVAVRLKRARLRAQKIVKDSNYV